MKKAIWAIIVLGAVIALPLIFRRPGEKMAPAALQLVVISAHNEAIRYEFETAFREYYRQKHNGAEVSIDWRTIGGTSEIVRYIKSTFTANFQHDWLKANPGAKWSDQLAQAVFSPRTNLEDGSEGARARRSFLQGDTGIGIDVFFGGGQYDHNNLANAGILVPAGVRERHPEWFSGETPVLTQGGGGETWYDKQDRYYAACYSCFGIVYNKDRLARAGFSKDEIASFGRNWKDLADPRLYGAVGVADPTQSGSINKCFEMIIQKTMQEYCQSRGITDPTPAQLDKAWAEALGLIRAIGGNAAYLTFSASKVPVDAAAGQIAAGMCIDFYGRSQAEWEKAHVGRETIVYRTPEAGSTVSADPIAILRGAPNHALAQEFVDFVLSKEPQRLWGRYSGVTGGPRQYTLYRLPVRRDLYTPEERAAGMCIGDEAPFELANSFIYRGAWTARLFNVMRNIIKVMIIDCGPELRQRWGEIAARGGWDAMTPEERERFCALPFQHHEALAVTAALDTPEKEARATRQWVEFFRKKYSQDSASK